MESELYKKDIGDIDIILYIISLLRNYDQKSCKKTNKCNINPYEDTLLFTTKENKKIKISKDLQQQVIIQWKLMNSQELWNDKHEYNSTISGMFVEIMLCILVLIIMLYLFAMTKHIIIYI